MKHTCKRRGTRSRSPGRKESRKRALKALAAAGAIAGGTQAYALPVRFDNPAHGEAGHFHWADESPPGGRHLDLALPASEQPNLSASAVIQFIGGTYAHVGLGALGETCEVEVGGFNDYFLMCVNGGETIPSGPPWAETGLSYMSGYGSECPDGTATYLGVRFDLGFGWQYGWIGVVRTGLELEAFAWGRETEPGVPIPAGALSKGACFGPEGCVECTQAECEAMGGKYYRDGITCEEVDIPTVSEWGLAIMALALLAAGTWVVRKRLPQPSEA